jgi:hypothetical protein
VNSVGARRKEKSTATEEWLAHIYRQLLQSLDENATELLGLGEGASLQRIAWLARNILELRMWVGYCTDSKDKALRFADDALRDAVKFLTIDEKEVERGLEEEVSFRPLRSVIDLARDAGFNAISSPTFAWEAAKKINMGKYYRSRNRIFSKLAHATPLSLLAPLPREHQEQLRNQIVDEALRTAEEGIRLLEAVLAGIRMRMDVMD